MTSCFTDMLSEWLKITDPLPSWEGVIAALKQPAIGHGPLARRLEKELGMTMERDDFGEANGKLKCVMHFIISNRDIFFACSHPREG